MAFKPRNQYLTVKPVSDKIDKTEGGIFLPDSAKEYPLSGVVLATGDGVYNAYGEQQPLKVKAGDNILYIKDSGRKLETDDNEVVLLLEASDILAII